MCRSSSSSSSSSSSVPCENRGRSARSRRHDDLLVSTSCCCFNKHVVPSRSPSSPWRRPPRVQQQRRAPARTSIPRLKMKQALTMEARHPAVPIHRHPPRMSPLIPTDHDRQTAPLPAPARPRTRCSPPWPRRSSRRLMIPVARVGPSRPASSSLPPSSATCRGRRRRPSRPSPRRRVA